MEELDLKAIYTMFCRKKFLVIGIIIIFIIFGAFYSYKIVKPEYKASTTLILGRIVDSTESTVSSIDNRITQTEIAINSNLVSTYSELIKSKTLIKKVKDNLNIDLKEEILRESITVSRLSETELIEITVKSDNPDMASNIANEIAKVFSEKIQEIYNIQNVYIIDAAVPDYLPYNINHIKDIIIYAVLGVIVSFGVLILYSILDTTIKSADDIENEIGLKNLNIIPIKKQSLRGEESNSELITYENSKSVTSEAFRTLRTNIQFSNINNKENKILLLTSCFSSEGKSYVSANLAVAFAQAGKKVILIDADMRRGRQAKIFNIPNELGLSNYLSNLDRNGMEINERINKYINETEVKNLNVITSGNVPPNPSELLTSNRLPELVKELGVFYDLVIFDGAPILPIADSLILARMANSTVLISLYNKTKKDELLKAKKDIQNIGGRIIGTVLNKVPINNYEYNSRYYYSSSDDTSSIFKKLEIRRQIKKEKKEKIKSEFKGLNFEREKRKNRKIKFDLKSKFKNAKYKLSNFRSKIKDFLSKFKKTETKLLDMSKDEKEIFIKNQKRERQIQIKKEKQAQKEKRRLEKQEYELNRKIEKEREKEEKVLKENVSYSIDINTNEIKENELEDKNKEEKKLVNESVNVNLDNNVKNEKENENQNQINIFTENEFVEEIAFSNDNKPSEAELKVQKMGNFIEETIKLETEKHLDDQINKIENEIKSEEEKNLEEIKKAEEIERKKQERKEKIDKLKEKAKLNFEKFKVSFNNGKKELKDLSEKLSEEFKAKREENSARRIEKKAEKDAYNLRKSQDKAEKDALRKEELLKYRQIRDEERAKQAVIREEERKVRDAERELKRQEKEKEKNELMQKRLAQKGLREAEKENRRNKKEALKMKQKEEARIKEEILEDNLYPKTKYNKDI